MKKQTKIPARKSRHSASHIQSRMYGMLCLLIMVFYFIRPVLPFIEYAVNKEYIAHNLCINKDNPQSCCEGKCYLHKQIKNNSEPMDADNENKLVKVQKIEDHLKSNDILIQSGEEPVKLIVVTSIQIISFFVQRIFIPPRN